MSQGSQEESAGARIQQVQADAYRAYVRALQEGLAKVDVDALAISGAQGPVALPTFATNIFTYHCWQTWNTWHTWNTLSTLNTLNTIHTIHTESTLGPRGF